MQEVCRPVTPVLRYAALASFLTVAMAACTTSPPHRTAGTVHPRPAPSQSALALAACPAGHLLSHRAVIYIEWVDFLRFRGRQYVAAPAVTIGASQLGPVITHIRCSLAARDDHRHADIPIVDGSAAFLPAGSAVYEVLGYSPRCRLAGYWGGQLRVYLAQHTLRRQSAPLPCALAMPAR
jgi:hypothetical protein